MKMTLINKKNLFLVIFLLVVYTISTTGSYLYFTIAKVSVEKDGPDEQTDKKSAFELAPFPTLVDSKTYNFLLLGQGGAGHAGGALADAMIVAQVDPVKKRAALISVPRDIWVSLPNKDGSKVDKKLNHAYALGGGQLAKDAVSTVVGMPINYFVAVNFDGLEALVNTLDGVEVDVPKTFDDYWYPVRGLENETCGKTGEEIKAIVATMSGFEGEKQFPCRYEHLHFDAGLREMDGATALKFVRSRHSTQHGGDFSRSERQLALLYGIKNKLLSVGAFDKAVPFFNKLSRMVATDIDEGTVELLVETVGNVSEYSMVNIQLTEDNVLQPSQSFDGQFILLPKANEGGWKKAHEFIKSEIEKEREK